MIVPEYEVLFEEIHFQFSLYPKTLFWSNKKMGGKVPFLNLMTPKWKLKGI
jgi:hypothetical protein